MPFPSHKLCSYQGDSKVSARWGRGSEIPACQGVWLLLPLQASIDSPLLSVGCQGWYHPYTWNSSGLTEQCETWQDKHPANTARAHSCDLPAVSLYGGRYRQQGPHPTQSQGAYRASLLFLILENCICRFTFRGINFTFGSKFRLPISFTKLILLLAYADNRPK